MDLSYKQEVTVGGLVLLAIGLFIAGTTWLSGRSIGSDSDDYWHVQFHDVAGLKVSSAVRVSGVPVGRVEQIELAEPGKVLVGISLQDGIVPKTDATALVSSVGFVGDAVVDLDPGRAAAARPKSEVILGSQAIGLMDRAGQLSYRADSVLMGAQAIVNQETAEQLRATLAALQGTLKAAERTMNVYGNPRQGPTAALTETMTALRNLSTRLDSTLGNPALARTLSRTDTLTSNLAVMSAQFTATGARLDSLLGAMQRGQGTLGKLAADSALYYDIRNFTQSATRFMDELQKHPGKISPTIKLCC
jgi:phospholipid/cholesterol/gamma-HCH transport system substrate-binding protein